jgi:hypothetical protein
MPWKRRGNREYYYKSRRVGGRVVSEYFGPGTPGLAVATLDAEAAEEREEGREADREGWAALERADREVRATFDDAFAAFGRLMESMGYRRHRRGEWRRRRGAPPMTTTTEIETTADDAAPPRKVKVFGRRGDVAALHALVYRLGGEDEQ